MPKRLNKIILFAGRRGCGKTTLAKKLLAKSKKKILVVDSFDHPDYRDFKEMKIDKLPLWKNGNYRIFDNDPYNTLEIAANNCYDCTMVLEDARRYIEPSVQKPIKQLIVEHRNRNIDIVMMFHSLKDIPPYICSMHNDIVLFKTNDNVAQCLTKFSNWNDIVKAHNLLMKSNNNFISSIINLQ
jgi:tRNA A37 threonylcarbamoyladenosine biosynthesis protein TsaE